MLSDRELKRRVRIEINDIMDNHCNSCSKMAKALDLRENERAQICAGCDIGKKLRKLSNYLDSAGVKELRKKLEAPKEEEQVQIETKEETKTLTKEDYLKLKGQGLSNREIAQKYKINLTSVYKYRQIWGLAKPRQRKTNEKPQENKVQENKNDHDPVSSPSHYTAGGIETIDYMRAKLTNEQFKGYLIGNIIKYSSRFQLKNGVEDIKKMLWYGNKLIEVLEEEA